MSATGIVVAVVGLVVAYALARPLLATYRRYRGTRLVTCPETKRPAAVEVDAFYAAATRASLGGPELQLASCSRWPERRACGQECLAQIEAAPEDCLVRNIVARWYAGRRCAFCGKAFGDLRRSEHRPAVRLDGGKTILWPGIRAADLPAILACGAPVCWSCHVAETFRREHPELVVDDPPATTRAGGRQQAR